MLEAFEVWEWVTAALTVYPGSTAQKQIIFKFVTKSRC